MGRCLCTGAEKPTGDHGGQEREDRAGEERGVIPAGEGGEWTFAGGAQTVRAGRGKAREDRTPDRRRVGHAPTRFDEEGVLVDSVVREQLAEVADELVAAVTTREIPARQAVAA